MNKHLFLWHSIEDLYNRDITVSFEIWQNNIKYLSKNYVNVQIELLNILLQTSYSFNSYNQ